jgi:hypothetical protein
VTTTDVRVSGQGWAEHCWPGFGSRSGHLDRGVVVGLTFLFGLGNVLGVALRLGVAAWVAPLIAPAVDLSILELLVGTRVTFLLPICDGMRRMFNWITFVSCS